MQISNLFISLLASCILHLSFLSFANAEEKIIVGKSHAIGVILPLSGKYADFGEGALKGVLLSAGIFKSGRDRDEDAPIEIVVKDSKDDPDATINAVKELADDKRVLAAVGPLLSVTAFEGAKKAQETGLPIITLSQRDGLPQIGDYVFRNFLTLDMQARAMARYAVSKTGLKRFVILYPDNPYGRGLYAPFKDEIIKNGGKILEESLYTDGQTDFSKEIKRLFKVKETERKEGRRVVKIFNPTISADAIYIPDYYETVSIIMHHLAYFNVKGITLLGSNGWNSQRLIELGGRNAEGALFVDGFFQNSARDETKLFVNSFFSTYGMLPSIIEAEAFDAAGMPITILKDGDIDRDGIRKRLSMIKGFKGATGSIKFDSDGDAVKDLFILSIRNGEIVELN